MQTAPFTIPEGSDISAVRLTLREDVAKRLEPVCADWPREDFDAIVDKVTETTLKYAESSPPEMPPA
jgi:hypothetical protein